jgi:hypothetical protein
MISPNLVAAHLKLYRVAFSYGDVSSQRNGSADIGIGEMVFVRSTRN